MNKSWIPTALNLPEITLNFADVAIFVTILL